VDDGARQDATLASLVELAVTTDEPAALIAAAGAELHRPLGVVDRSGSVVGRAPSDESGERAVSIARAAARTALVAPPGWALVALERERVPLGVLAVGGPDRPNGDAGPILRLLPALLADQMRRRALMRLQRGAFVRRLVSTPSLTAHHARREAADIGLDVAQAYWPAVLAWRAGGLHPEALETVEREALARADTALTAHVNDVFVLLHPAGSGNDERAAAWFEEVAALARELAPAAGVHAVAAEQPAALDALSGQAGHLAELARRAARLDGGRALTWAREYALDDLLASQIDPDAARRFVDAHVGRVIAWDREHGTNLLGILEASLDHPRHDRAAQKCFMHRNTFRHWLGKATELLGEGLEPPEGRLAVHVAIKMHRVGGSAPTAPARRAGRRRQPPPHPLV
jgi:sugar diacid utilization regulator